MTTWVYYVTWAIFLAVLIGVLYVGEIWGLRLIDWLTGKCRRKREGDRCESDKDV